MWAMRRRRVNRWEQEARRHVSALGSRLDFKVALPLRNVEERHLQRWFGVKRPTEINSDGETSEFVIAIRNTFFTLLKCLPWPLPCCSQTPTCCCAAIGCRQHWMQKCCFPNLNWTTNSAN